MSSSNARKNAGEKAGNTPIIIKKYPNRRLYDTHTSAYVTLEDVRELVKNGVEFTVQDAKTGEDLTRQVLAQIIFEMESSGHNLLPEGFLRSLIQYYGHQMQEVLPQYLDVIMQQFSRNQDRVREMFGQSFGTYSPLTPFGEIGKQNMALFQKAFEMFTPQGLDGMFGVKGRDGDKKPS